MIRAFHRWPGLVLAALLVLLALSGAVLSVFPAAERLSSPQAAGSLSVAVLAQRVQDAYPGVEQIRRAPTGQVTAYWFEGDNPGAAVIDPATGQGVGSADPNTFMRWMINLHRSLFLGDSGRIVMALGAGAMLILALSGVALVARRTGGLRRWFAPLRGPLAGRLHVEITRVAVVGLALSALTALWMTASTFGLLPDAESPPAFPAEVSGQTGIALTDMPALAATPVSELRSLAFPYAGDATDVYTLKTDRGTGYLDQGTGALLAWGDLTGWERVSETIYMLHTGEGAAVLGLILGLMALSVPVIAVTGIVTWFMARRGRPRIRGNAVAGRAETIVLVGSEGGSTWGFAATLHAALSQTGQSVHVAAMSSFQPGRYGAAKRILVLAATYGDGDAPASARGFLDRLATLPSAPEVPLAILGFGDRSFPDYCSYARRVSAATEAIGWQLLIPADTVDRQSPQDFARWGRALGAAMGLELELNHRPVHPRTTALTLVSRRDYGDAVQAPAAILRFALPRATFWQRLTGRAISRYAPGDLLGVIPVGSELPRFYSLASGRGDGFIEIAVRKLPGGLCSGQLLVMEPGDSIRAFVRHNAAFRPGRGRAPLILVGAGTGIAPLAGFIRGNFRRRPIHLFYGIRHPDSDFLYGEELTDWERDGMLARRAMAFSRGQRPLYVQEALRRDGAEVIRLIREGARVMVCGGREMAAGVAAVLADVLAPAGLTPAVLKAEGRYVEDIY